MKNARVAAVAVTWSRDERFRRPRDVRKVKDPGSPTARQPRPRSTYRYAMGEEGTRRSQDLARREAEKPRQQAER